MQCTIPLELSPERAIANGIPSNQAKWMLPMISVGTLIGRFLAALTTFCPMLNVIYLTSNLIFLAGMLAVISSFVLTNDFIAQCAFAIGWGAFTCAMIISPD